jgi:hypothetical protein
MAGYKVPQDVEAEDKLIGPFSFRQFIYLMVAALGLFISYILGRIFIALFILPLPFVIALLALSLPLRKDQPMETYLIAMIKFFFKPRRRLWDPEGTISLVNIVAPKFTEGPQLKEFGGDEASQRLAYLSQIVDTRGWATRGVASANDNMSDIYAAEANQTQDILDPTSGVGRIFDERVAQADDQRMTAVRQQFQAAAQATQSTTALPAVDQPSAQIVGSSAPPTPPATVSAGVSAQPVYVEPTKTQASEQNSSSDIPSSPDIIRLANNNDLSISAIAREAHRLEDTGDEVVISLR